MSQEDAEEKKNRVKREKPVHMRKMRVEVRDAEVASLLQSRRCVRS